MPHLHSSSTSCVHNNRWPGQQAYVPTHRLTVHFHGLFPFPVLPFLSLTFLYSPLSFFTFSLHYTPTRSYPLSLILHEILSKSCAFLLQPSSCACTLSSSHNSLSFSISSALSTVLCDHGSVWFIGVYTDILKRADLAAPTHFKYQCKQGLTCMSLPYHLAI